MRVQNNILAMNAYRNYNNNTSALGKNLEKLSSGYRINRAGDDAAGLAISEKMRAQITGLGTAQKNSQDGISLIQTAEGAMAEVHDMLSRMSELATQSANGTYSDQDRQEIQKEIDALCDEIDRIYDNADFNGIKLFKTKGTVTLQVGATAGETLSLNLSMNISSTQLFGASAGGVGGTTSGAKIGGPRGVGGAGGAGSTRAASSSGPVSSSSGGKLDVSNANSARAAITTIKAAISTISNFRGNLGALQNRLEHNIKNLSVTEENMQNAESAIRDTDVADEMTKYTKNNILIQSAQAMLAQANQVPQGVLQLLQ